MPEGFPGSIIICQRNKKKSVSPKKLLPFLAILRMDFFKQPSLNTPTAPLPSSKLFCSQQLLDSESEICFFKVNNLYSLPATQDIISYMNVHFDDVNTNFDIKA
jgi:hypothetical protein